MHDQRPASAPEDVSHAVVRLYMCHHGAGYFFSDEVFVPLHVGRALTDRLLPFAGDDTGDNISAKNREYCELSAIYWMWKNAPPSDWLGVMHYRRLFDFRQTGRKLDRYGCIPVAELNDATRASFGLNAAQVLACLESNPGVDAILPRKWSVRSAGYATIRAHYGEAPYHHAADLELTRQVIAERHPDYLGAFDRYMADQSGYFTNMFIFRREIFDRYCAWLFSILFAVERRHDRSNYGPQARRVFGYLAERLLSVFLIGEIDRGLKILELDRVFFQSTPVSGVAATQGSDAMSGNVPQLMPLDGQDIITVVIAADDNFVPHLAALIQSITHSLAPDRGVEILILDGGITKTNRNALFVQTRGVSSVARLRFLDCSAMYREIAVHMHFSVATFFRIALGDILPRHSRVLYLDCDTIVLADISRLWDLDLGGACVAAAPDLIMKSFIKRNVLAFNEALPAGRYVRERLGLREDGRDYFQAGVLVFDLDRFRDLGIAPRALADLRSNQYWFLDQDVLNKYLQGHVKLLDTAWNCISTVAAILPGLDQNWREKALEDIQVPKIVHYAGQDAKPWNNAAAPLAQFYWYFLRQTVWYEQVCWGGQAHGRAVMPAPSGGRMLRAARMVWRRLPLGLRTRLWPLAQALKKKI
ncbi:DUF4422 domain-containing protein [Acetobacter sp. TBRC 12305]|uniref:DUF4422 domain-containing protein n=1 Tax=Acetobacter garciniae TaxID=2817435 RepID=A0A939HJD5_9PROT|nr:DUF4422 domain-containing protein [Acetobacter garciniae]MBO1323820.1 DUF4422 domain-containing protein [Acetobacter garciniae]MBX0343509.1 DUF4422 domain-containing protein [Acetobacter garciniae]